MPSLVKTLPRWYWAVRELMNSRAPISGFDRPSRAIRATRISWAVSSWLAAAAARAAPPAWVVSASRATASLAMGMFPLRSEQCRTPGVEISLAGEVQVERPGPQGRAEQRRCGVTAQARGRGLGLGRVR